MKKILSILLALGLVLGMVAATFPVSAQPPAPGDWTRFTAVVANPCEFELSNYTFTFTPTADLHSGTHSITIRFPDGTGFPEVWRNGHITVDGGSGAVAVFGGEVTVDGNDVTFLLPVDIVGPNVLVTVMFQSVIYAGQTTGIRNPAAGTYFYFVKTSRAPNSEWVRSGWNGLRYLSTRIQPAVASYYWGLDFGATYPGIAYDFVPPFKACGQESDFDPDWEPGETTTPYDSFEFVTGKWASYFTLDFGAGWGCDLCAFDTSMVLKSAPTGGVVTVVTNVTGNVTQTMSMVLDGDRIVLPNGGTDIDYIEWDLAIHFSTVGTYEICFEAYVRDPDSCAACQNVERCETFEVKQWKDATYIELGEKWNLISLPIVPFDTSIESILAPLALPFPVPAFNGFLAQLAFRSVWHYDRCLDEWFVYGNGQTSLETLEDGKSYWLRMMTAQEWNNTFGFLGWTGWWPGFSPARLWLFGTETPMPPAGPSAYVQCEGWNMLGFRSVIDREVGGVVGDDGTEYLYGHTFGEHFTAVYGWTGTAWQSLATTSFMDVGQGYWAYWQLQRTVNPPL